MHTAKVERRTYRVSGGGKRLLTGVLLFLSCLMILAGLLRDEAGGLRVAMKSTPSPTPFGRAFDETPDEREIGLAARSFFAIQLGVFDSEESAKILADSFTARGAAGFIRKDSRHRVLAALYPTREEAQTVRQQLQTQHAVDSYVYEIALPEILLRVNGMAGQLDALEAGLRFLPAAVEQFCQSAISMDRRDLSVEQELERLGGIASQADTLKTVVVQRCASVQSATVDMLIDLLGQVGECAGAVAAASPQGTVAMAAQMKLQTFTLLTGVEAYLYSFGK